MYKRQLFSHTYHYIGMEPVHGLYEFESDDADSGEFTYFFLAPDTSAETYQDVYKRQLLLMQALRRIGCR